MIQRLDGTEMALILRRSLLTIKEYAEYTDLSDLSNDEANMAKKENTSSCGTGLGCCKVESVVSVDERGQMVLPKELRERANIAPGDKLALVSCEKEGSVCCIVMLKTEQFSQMVKSTLGPILKDII
jgi:antitoxin PrlF